MTSQSEVPFEYKPDVFHLFLLCLRDEVYNKRKEYSDCISRVDQKFTMTYHKLRDRVPLLQERDDIYQHALAMRRNNKSI